jgi:hypothetical protein
MEALADFVQHFQDGEVWVHTKIYPKRIAVPHERDTIVTRNEALDASGMEERMDDRMGEVQLNAPTISSAFGIWVIQQTGHANV